MEFIKIGRNCRVGDAKAYRINEAAELLGVSRSTMYRLMDSRKILYETMGFRRYIRGGEIARYLHEGPAPEDLDSRLMMVYPSERYWTMDISRIMSISQDAAKELCQSGELPAIAHGTRYSYMVPDWSVKGSDLLEYLRREKRNNAENLTKS